MIDYLWETRQALIENFQGSMKAIRLLMGYSIIELAEYVGVTRQTINNLESGKSKMSVMQFLSIAAVVDNYIAANGNMYQAIETILDSNNRTSMNRFGTSFSGFSLLKRWFLLFEGTETEILSHSGGVLDDVQMRQMVRGYKIFLDDTALFSDNTEDFIKFLANYLISENEKVIITLRAVERIQERTQDLTCSHQAVKALRLLNWMQQKNIVQIRGEGNDSSHHDTILSVFLKFRGKHRLCLITQDRTFANEVLRLNETRDSEGFDIIIGHISEGGRLSMYTSREKEQNADDDESLNQGGNGYPALNTDADETLVLDGANAVGEVDELGTEFDATGAQADSVQNGLTDWEYL